MEKFIKKVSHYNQGKYECIEVMREIFGDVIVIGFIIGSAFKYLWRFREKGGIADLMKSRDYMCRLRDSDFEIIEKMLVKNKGAKATLQDVVDDIDNKIKRLQDEEQEQAFQDAVKAHKEKMAQRKGEGNE